MIVILRASGTIAVVKVLHIRHAVPAWSSDARAEWNLQRMVIDLISLSLNPLRRPAHIHHRAAAKSSTLGLHGALRRT